MSDASSSASSRTKKPRRKGALIAAGAAALLLLGGGGFYALTGDSAPALLASDVRVVGQKDVASRIPANGTIESARSVTLFTTLSGPVEALNVAVGDRVGPGQEVARIDVSNLQQELDQKLASEAQSLTGAMNQVEDAQNQYNQLRATLDAGLNAELNSAAAAQRQAEEAFTEAQQNFDFAQQRAQLGRNQQLVAGAAAVDDARNQVISAGIAAGRAANQTLATALAGTEEAGAARIPVNITDTLANLESANGMDQAVDNLAKQQAAYTDALAEVDKSLADAQRSVAAAFAAKNDADRAYQAAELSVQQQLATRATAVDQAERNANITRTVSGAGTEGLKMDINRSTVTAPLGGVVTEVVAEQGKPATGTLLTIADDKQLKITATLRESDAAGVKPGQKVTFTTPSTGAKEFTGTVHKVSTVAAKPTGEGTAEAKKAQFPVEITIDGSPEGLRLGGSAKLRIITSSAKDVLAVPRTAIDTDGEHPVVYVAVERDGHTLVEARDVTLGEGNDTEVAITAGLGAGDIVLTNATSAKPLAGTPVTLPPLDAEPAQP
ncbi:macrolide transporter [Corynebacterium sp. 13CS0277]|uniref:HlyD family efflux transporter periplasmic adaptor subunit n=1 Tax=Corynebacterium sp. 13CS0277 TaxID=2071994 RepID=UPI000D042ECA|nr:HlyD family efflux transporter periplasmic adaptor subunit [Corynebacterium sp. 13CS0277]PRQ11616.1 macrolide transporter [Corynebacterium sp. 13CS0277]